MHWLRMLGLTAKQAFRPSQSRSRLGCDACVKSLVSPPQHGRSQNIRDALFLLFVVGVCVWFWFWLFFWVLRFVEWRVAFGKLRLGLSTDMSTEY